MQDKKTQLTNSDILRRTNLLLNKKICEGCGTEFIPRSHQKFCTKICAQKNKSRGRFLIFERDNFTCIYCGASTLDGKNIKLHLDHIYPKSRDGKDTAGNLVTACQRCNLEKYNSIMSSDNIKKIKEVVRLRNANENISQRLTIKFET